MNECRIAVVGATGAVGRIFLEILQQRKFPISSIELFASERSVGKHIMFNGEPLTVKEIGSRSFDLVDIVFISANGDISNQVAPIATKAGAIVIDDSSTFRMISTVPLVVPEINVDDLDKHEGIISIPNCSTTPLAMVLKALSSITEIKRVIVDTYQSVSGTGTAAIEELNMQSKQDSNDNAIAKVYPHKIAFNLFPHIEPFLDNGYTKEEWKMIEETRKILHQPELAISATCVRVPVKICHSEAIHIEFANPINLIDAKNELSNFPGIQILDDPSNNEYPMPLNVTGKDDVFVGRLRQDASHPNGLAMWVVSDNLRKGAGLNAIQIAEAILQKGLIQHI